MSNTLLMVKSKNTSPKASGKTVPHQVSKTVPHPHTGHPHPLHPYEVGHTALIDCKHLTNRANFYKLYFEVAKHIFYNPKSPMVPVICDTCKSTTSPLFACLQCIHFSCHHGNECHFTPHNQETGHALSIECSTGIVRCIVCKVYVWRPELQNILECVRKGEIPRIIQEPDNQAVDLNTHVFSAHCIGVKGLYNLGNTCFMNSVLQPLLHIPALVKFFLADISTPAHPKFTCATSKQEAKSCVACEVDSLFSRMYNGKKKPFCPSDLLYSVWKSSAEMAGYEQQDAHEFLICLRTCLHQSLGGQQFNCNCIIHQLFAGVLQSDVICTMCGKKTETYDPFLDLSLDITPESTSLSGCLQNFTKSEIIPVDVYRCEGCGQVASEFSKRMSIRVAPKTLVVHLKRFEHGAQSRFKIDKHVDFPTSISISSFMTEINEPEEANFSMEDVNHQDSSLYRLMGVVAHVGGLDSGHYTSFVKYRKDWFFIDDAHVSLATEDKVLGSQAYMLFYSS